MFALGAIHVYTFINVITATISFYQLFWFACGSVAVVVAATAEKTFGNLVVFSPLPAEENPHNLCLYSGYIGHEEAVIKRNYIPHIGPRGEEKPEIERNPDFKAR